VTVTDEEIETYLAEEGNLEAAEARAIEDGVISAD
jgi:hypothetical protein